MTAIAFAGDCATSTMLATVAGWPAGVPHGSHHDVVAVEADPTGGSLAAWFDVAAAPSISTVVAALHQRASDAPSSSQAWPVIEPLIRRSGEGPRFLPAPFRAREARAAVSEAARSLLPALHALDGTICCVDTGRIDLANPNPGLQRAHHIVACHRQETASAQAAAARLERFAESIEMLSGLGIPLSIAIIGDQPFAADEIAAFVAPHAEAFDVPVDPLAAAVLAGRSGVSERRLARLPLMRAAAAMATRLNEQVALGPADAATAGAQSR